MYPHYVYVLKNTVTGKCYVGCTKNIKNRMQDHKWRMRTGKHSVEQINEDCKKYGENSFVYAVIGKYGKLEALQLEAFYSMVLRTKDQRYGYNYKDKKGTGIVAIADRWRTPPHTVNNSSRRYHLKTHGTLIPPKLLDIRIS